ncbi:MAG: Ig-like domain-containing protein [bacterium]
MKSRNTGIRYLYLYALIALIVAGLPASAFAQGSIYGAVQNSDLSTPANGEISFFGYLDDTDEEIRIETSTGAGYDNGNWFDDFQNYLTESPGNPYDYHFYNTINSERYHLAKLIPSNSFQQEDILLSSVSWPSQPTGLTTMAISSTRLLVAWNGVSGLTYHVYRRDAVSNGSFFRLDNTSGLLTDPGVSDSFFVDTTVDGVSSYDYLIIAEDASGNYSRHSAVVTANSSSVSAPVVNSIDPDSGRSSGGTFVSINGSGFDMAGTDAVVGTSSLTGIVVVSPYLITGTTQAGTQGPVDVQVTNTASAMASNTLVGGYTYTANHNPVLASIGTQSGNENILLTFGVSASDPDGTTPTLTTSTLPGTAGFTDNGDGTGAFNWTPGFFDAGTYYVTFYATDDMAAVDSEIVQIDITDAGNQAPVLVSTGTQSGTENILLTFGVSATDAESTPALTTSTLPGTAGFTDNGDGTGDFNWTPSFTDAGTYYVTFYATDDSAAVDSEIVQVDITETGNQAPVLASIGTQSGTENILLTFGVSASDAESTPALTTSTLPGTSGFTDNGDGTGDFSWMPSFTDAGTYFVTFYATDDLAAVDSEIVQIDITEAGNQLPVLAAIGTQSGIENILLTFGVSATDAESTPVLTTSTLPGTAGFTDNGDGTGDFNWTPGFTDAGTYYVTFYATDDSAAVDSEIVQIDITEAGNQLPVLAAIGTQSGTEDVLLTFGVSATDAESTPVLTTSTLPGTAVFTDIGDGTGDFNWTPGFTDAGTYFVTFYATDDLAAVDSEIVQIDITETGNQLPVLVSIGTQTGNENVLLTFGVSATDAESTPVLTTSTLPGTSGFTDNGDGTGDFNWTPSFTDAGTYFVTFYATDDMAAVDSEIVQIDIAEAGNQLPVLATIGTQSGTEDVQLTFGVSATDAESTPVLTTSTLPGTAGFTDNGDGTGDFNWTPSFTDAGTYFVIFYATDDLAAVDSEIVQINITEAGNQLPVLAAIGTQTGNENVLLTFGVSATDAESTPALTTSTLPGTAGFTDNGDGTGDFNWTPSFTDAGTYFVTFYATDDLAAVDSEIVQIDIAEAGNQAPVLAAIGTQSGSEDVLLTFGVSATDAESTPALTTSTLPGTAGFTDNGDGTGAFNWTPSLTDAGTYYVTFYATDDSSAVDSEIVQIDIGDFNQDPVLNPIGPQTISEDSNLNFTAVANDADGDTPLMTSSALPGSASYIDNGDGTGTFDWTPTYADSGVHLVTFYAIDSAYPTSMDSEAVTITVTNINQEPILNPIGARSVVEGGTLYFVVSASDPDGDTPVMTTSTLPGTAIFTDNGDGTGAFDWATVFTDQGVYYVTFYATDSAYTAAVDSEEVMIVVGEAGNQAPVLAAVNDTVISEGATLVVAVSATDPEGQGIVFTVSTTLNNYSFVDNGDGTGALTYQPDYHDAGVDTVRLFATDDGSPQATGSEVMVITTVNVNQPPEFDPAGPFGVEMLDTLVFTVTAVDSSDTLGARLFLSVVAPPANSQFIDHGDNTGTFTFRPDTTQVGIDTVTFLATDQGTPALSGNLLVEITVVATNFAPVLNAIGPQIIAEGEILTINLSATDPDGPPPSLDTANAPENSTFVDYGDGTGLYLLAPSFVQAGLYHVTFKAYDGIDVTKEIVMIEVTEAGNQRPEFDSVPSPSVTEGYTLNDVVTASDPDLDPVTITFDSTTMPVNFLYSDTGGGTAVFQFSPDYTQAGTYYVDAIVSDGELAETTTVVIDVIEAGNQTPEWGIIGDQSVVETHNLSFTINATDPDSTLPMIYGSGVPAGASFPDTAYGSAAFSWTPSWDDSGTYQVTFYLEDSLDPAIIDSQLITITVADSNRAPWIWVPSQIDTLAEGNTLYYRVTAWDDDGPNPVLTATLSGDTALAPNMTFYDSANGSGVLTFTPNYDQGDDNPTFYYVDFVASDSADTSIHRDPWPVTFRVYPTNQPPEMEFSLGTGPFTINEGDNLTFSVLGTDQDSPDPTLLVNNVPTNATWNLMLNNLGFFSFSPDFTQAGQYLPQFIVYDNQFKADTQVIEINVIDVGNQAPVFSTVLPDTIEVFTGISHDTDLVATDLDLDSIVLTAIYSIAEGAGFTDNGDGTGTFYYSPDVGVIGSVFQVLFIAEDYPAGAADTIVTHYRVNNFMRGDTDDNDKYTFNDIVVLTNYLFREGNIPLPSEAGDADLSGSINVSDIAYMVNFLYNSGPRPPQ